MALTFISLTSTSNAVLVENSMLVFMHIIRDRKELRNSLKYCE